MALSILVFLLGVFAFICGSIWGYSEGYSASIQDMKQATRDEALNRRKLSSQEV